MADPDVGIEPHVDNRTKIFYYQLGLRYHHWLRRQHLQNQSSHGNPDNANLSNQSIIGSNLPSLNPAYQQFDSADQLHQDSHPHDIQSAVPLNYGQTTNPFHNVPPLPDAAELNLSAQTVPPYHAFYEQTIVGNPLPTLVLPVPHTHTQYAKQIDIITRASYTFNDYRGRGCLACGSHNHTTCICGPSCCTGNAEALASLKKHGKFVFLDFKDIQEQLKRIAAQVCPTLGTTRQDDLLPSLPHDAERRTQKMQIHVIFESCRPFRAAWLDPQLWEARVLVKDDNMAGGPILQFDAAALDIIAHKMWSDKPEEYVKERCSTEELIQFAVKRVTSIYSLLAHLGDIGIMVPCFDSLSADDGPQVDHHRSEVKRKRRLAAFGLLDSLVWQLHTTLNEFMSLVDTFALENQESEQPSPMLRYSIKAVIQALRTTKVEWFKQEEQEGSTGSGEAGAIHQEGDGYETDNLLRHLQTCLQHASTFFPSQLLWYECFLGHVSETKPLTGLPDILKPKALCLAVSFAAQETENQNQNNSRTALAASSPTIFSSPRSVIDILRDDYEEESPSDQMVSDYNLTLPREDLEQNASALLLGNNSVATDTPRATHETTEGFLAGMQHSNSSMLANEPRGEILFREPSHGSKRTATESSRDSSHPTERPSPKRQKTDSQSDNDNASQRENEFFFLDEDEGTSSTATSSHAQVAHDDVGSSFSQVVSRNIRYLARGTRRMIGRGVADVARYLNARAVRLQQ